MPRFPAAVFVLWAACVATVGAASAAGGSPNGISVGAPKQFDERTLQIMLEQLSERLRTVQIVDQQKLSEHLLLQQGAEARDVATSLSLTTPIQPGVVTKETPVDGKLVPTERTTTEAALTPAAPALPDLMAAPGYAPAFGESSVDLLADQVSLSYQIFNLRMLLERSLTDRLFTAEPRLHAVVGFPVTLNPPRQARDRAAVVEITATAGGEPVSVVALMPMEKTYNTSALSSRSNAFGGSAVAKVITIGFQQRRRSQTFYLYRDADTLALAEDGASDESRSTFGWTFRPVLGRRAVAPGLRNMFVVLALPARDATTTPPTVKLEVRTYWQRLHRRTLTVRQERAAETMWSAELPIYTSQTTDNALRPTIAEVHWTTTGSNTAVVTVTGSNFFTGTTILLGNTRHDAPESGLAIKSPRTLELRTTPEALAFGDAVLSGRYGGAVNVEEAPDGRGRSGILINAIELPPSAGELATLYVDLQDRKGLDLDLDPRADRPLLTFADRVVPGPYDPQPLRCSARTERGLQERNCWRLTATVPAASLSKDAVVGVRFPLRGPSWASAQPLMLDHNAFSVSRLGGTDTTVRLGIHSTQPFFTNDDSKVRIDQLYTSGTEPKVERVSSQLLVLEVKTTALAANKKLIFLPDGAQPVVLAIPPATPPPAKPTLVEPFPGPVAKGSSPGVTFKGKDLGAVRKALFEGAQLPFRVSDDGSSITVYLSRAVTKEAGPVVILLETESGTSIPADLVVAP